MTAADEKIAAEIVHDAVFKYWSITGFNEKTLHWVIEEFSRRTERADAPKGEPVPVAFVNENLPYLVQYMRQDGSDVWHDMAAFDTQGPAERYAASCANETWEYRVVAHPHADADQDAVRVMLARRVAELKAALVDYHGLIDTLLARIIAHEQSVESVYLAVPTMKKHAHIVMPLLAHKPAETEGTK